MNATLMNGLIPWLAPSLARFTLIVLALSTMFLAAGAAPIGNNFVIAESGGRFPDVAFGTVDSKYLVTWFDGTGQILGRLVTASGALNGQVFKISETNGLYPAVAFNSTSNEFLVTWDDAGNRGGVILGQRVRASDGALVGRNFPIGSRYGGIRSTVAWSPVSSCYLVVYWGPAPEIDIYGQRVSGGGALLSTNFNISQDAIFSGYPAVAWGSSNNQFLVTWDNEDGNIYGRRVDAATGTVLGPAIAVTTGGAKDRSCVAYDTVNHHWLVQFNNGGNPGYSYDQYGQFVNPDGTLNGGAFPLAHTAAFEGDTQFGGDVAFAPIARRFFSSFGSDNGMGGQESYANGTAVGPQVVLGNGFYTSLNNAADPQRNRFLTSWEGMAGGLWYVFGQLSAATINPVTNFTAASQAAHTVALSWRNPNDAHLTGTMLRMKTNGYPTGPEDGLLVVDQPASPGANSSFTHTNLSTWVTCYYAAFAHDVGPNYALAAFDAATPCTGVVTVAGSDFNAGYEGWILETWRAGSLAFGTIGWDPGGNILSTGSGASNNRDTCTREGTIMTKVISTAGRQSIQVEYDVMASLAAPPGGSLSGTCPVLDGSDEDKLVVSYSVNGLNGPWNVAQVLNEGVELPTAWTRKIINLAGIPVTSSFLGLRFQWQFNSANDTGRVDNVRLLSGAATAPVPVLKVSPARLERTIQAGQNYPGDVFRVSNSGEGTLNYAISANVPWLRLNPTNGSSAGPEQRHLAVYNTGALAVDDYDALIEVASTNAANSPRTLPVRLHIIPASCFGERFDYYEGNLTVMGSANWSGTASNQLQVQNGMLKIIGDSGLASASHAVNCAGSNGLIGAHLKIQQRPGSGNFFWNIAFDDPAGINLARWYGGSTAARGRVGDNITPDMPLSGAGRWDDLYLKLDTVANTSEFFFNGVSFGAISHGTAAGNTIGSIRVERLDRAGAMNNEILFDNLTLGALDRTPFRLDATRLGNTVALSWPAERMGATLEGADVLPPAGAWNTITNAIVTTNGCHTVTLLATNPATFYRLRLH